MTRRLISVGRLTGIGGRMIRQVAPSGPVEAKILHLSTGQPLRPGGAWIAALCSGTANPHPEDLARASYIIEIVEPEPEPKAMIPIEDWGGRMVALIEPEQVNEFGWISLSAYLRAKGHEGYQLARLIVPFRDAVLAEYIARYGCRPPRRPVVAGGRLVDDIALSEHADRALVDRIYDATAEALKASQAA